MTRRVLVTLLCVAGLGIGQAAEAIAADYRMTVTETGKRDYYCTITVALENLSGKPLGSGLNQVTPFCLR